MPGIAKDILVRLPWDAAVQAAVMLLLTQVRLWGMASPLAVAWLCAAGRGRGAKRWLGIAAGAALPGGPGWTLPLLAGVAVLLPVRSREASVLMAGCLCVAEAAVVSGGRAALSVQWLLCGLAAAGMTIPLAAQTAAPNEGRWPAAMADRLRALRCPAFVGWAESAGTLRFPGRRHGQSVQAPPRERDKEARLTPRDRDRAARISRWLLAIGASAGAAILFGGQAGVALAAAALVLRPGGGIAEVLMAAALGMCGVPLASAGALIAMGVGFRLAHRQSRMVRALSGLSAAGVWLISGGREDALACLAALLPAAVMEALLPEPISPAEAACDDAALRLQVQRQVQDRLNALSDALTDMAKGPASGLDPPGESELLLLLRTRLCDGCVRYERCWNGRAGEGLRLLCELITRSANGTLPKAVLPDMMRRCLRANIIPGRLYGELERFSQVRRAQMARMDGVRRAQLTIGTAAAALQDAALHCAGAETGRQAVEEALRRSGILGVSVRPLSGGWALLRRSGWTQRESAAACTACGRALGRRYKSADCTGRMLCIAEAPGLVARIGWDGLSAEGSRSGDSIDSGALDDRRQLVVISDGMGVGEAASGMSRRVVQAIRKFLRAGIPPERAALLANQMMIAQGAPEMFATLDLCVIDNVKMEAVLVKMAACDSYLFREHDCSVIPGGRLPLGILAEAEPQVTVLALRPGDVLMMGTDGAMEGLDPDTAQQCLIRHRQADEKYQAREIIRLGRQKRVHADDMTLAVIGIARARDGGTDMASGG